MQENLNVFQYSENFINYFDKKTSEQMDDFLKNNKIQDAVDMACLQIGRAHV